MQTIYGLKGKHQDKADEIVGNGYIYNADISDDKISLFGVKSRQSGIEIYRTIFRVGDKAEYDSYNLSYIGTITKITNKTVTIEAHGRTHRLNLYQFAWRNYDFDLAQRTEYNNKEMMCL